MSNTGIPKVNVAAGAASDEQPEVDVSDEEFLQFDTSGVPVIVTLTKVMTIRPSKNFYRVLSLWVEKYFSPRQNVKDFVYRKQNIY